MVSIELEEVVDLVRAGCQKHSSKLSSKDEWQIVSQSFG